MAYFMLHRDDESPPPNVETETVVMVAVGVANEEGEGLPEGFCEGVAKMEREGLIEGLCEGVRITEADLVIDVDVVKDVVLVGDVGPVHQPVEHPSANVYTFPPVSLNDIVPFPLRVGEENIGSLKGVV